MKKSDLPPTRPDEGPSTKTGGSPLGETGGLPPWVRYIGDNSWQLLLHVQPGAKKNAVAGEMDGRLRVRIAAQAVDNKANKALTAYVAKLLQIRPNRVRLESGDASRKKTLTVYDLPDFDWNALGVPDVPS